MVTKEWSERDRKFVTKDSGKREKHPTGAVRDIQEGKGRYDLISPFAIKRIAGVYERGSEKYADRNWEKGFVFSRCLNSALRHIFQYMMGMRDEDHLAQAAWNLMALLHFEETHPELDDMPHYVNEDKPVLRNWSSDPLKIKLQEEGDR